MIGIIRPAMTVALIENFARKMPAGTPALLFPLRVTQLRAVMPQLLQIRADRNWNDIQPSQFKSHQNKTHQHRNKRNSPSEQETVERPGFHSEIQINHQSRSQQIEQRAERPRQQANSSAMQIRINRLRQHFYAGDFADGRLMQIARRLIRAAHQHDFVDQVRQLRRRGIFALIFKALRERFIFDTFAAQKKSRGRRRIILGSRFSGKIK